jgi:hypothetical protein
MLHHLNITKSFVLGWRALSSSASLVSPHLNSPSHRSPMLIMSENTQHLLQNSLQNYTWILNFTATFLWCASDSTKLTTKSHNQTNLRGHAQVMKRSAINYCFSRFQTSRNEKWSYKFVAYKVGDFVLDSEGNSLLQLANPLSEKSVCRKN